MEIPGRNACKDYNWWPTVRVGLGAFSIVMVAMLLVMGFNGGGAVPAQPLIGHSLGIAKLVGHVSSYSAPHEIQSQVLMRTVNPLSPVCSPRPPGRLFASQGQCKPLYRDELNVVSPPFRYCPVVCGLRSWLGAGGLGGGRWFVALGRAPLAVVTPYSFPPHQTQVRLPSVEWRARLAVAGRVVGPIVVNAGWSPLVSLVRSGFRLPLGFHSP